MPFSSPSTSVKSFSYYTIERSMPICSGFPSIKKPTNHIFGQGEKSKLGPTKSWNTFSSVVLMDHTEKSSVIKRDVLGANVYDH